MKKNHSSQKVTKQDLKKMEKDIMKKDRKEDNEMYEKKKHKKERK